MNATYAIEIEGRVFSTQFQRISDDGTTLASGRDGQSRVVSLPEANDWIERLLKVGYMQIA